MIDCLPSFFFDHQNCFKKSNFTVINFKSTCPNCILLVTEHYNPFKELGEQNEVASGNEHDDKSYNENFLEMFDCINKASSVLESCSQYTLSSVHMLTSDEIDFTTFFYNIDGNKSNFDTFAAEISLQKHKYSIIGLAETNTGKQKGDLYHLDHYTGFYNDKMDYKSKGTGVCLYLHNSFNATVNNTLCTTTPNLESLFLTVNKNGNKVYIGVIYRSPNGNAKDFITELLHLTSNFPKNMTTAILGDFNFNLNKSSDADTELFEVTFLSQGFFPLISLSTHSTSDTQSSCIDNILTNNIEAVSVSGVICDKGTHHSPIFAMFNLNLNKSTPKTEKHLFHYNFSNKNIESLVQDLESNFLELFQPADCPDF